MINYNQDFYGWTQEQVSLLKEGRFSDIDIENLIEEVETMGRSEKRSLESRFTVLMTHLLKWKYQPERRGNSWYLTIVSQRIKLMSLLHDNPGLKSQLTEIIINAYRLARVEASKETFLSLNSFDILCPWDYQQLIDETFFPD